jgi:hypothetical protein
MFRVFGIALAIVLMSSTTTVVSAETCVRITHSPCLNVRSAAKLGKNCIGRVNIGDKVKIGSCSGWCKLADRKNAYFSAKWGGALTYKSARGCGRSVVRAKVCGSCPR